MSADRPVEMRKYVQVLRVIGRHLDAEPGEQVRVSESESGFDLQYQPFQGGPDMQMVHFSWDRLEDLSVFQSASRGVTRRHVRRLVAEPRFPGGRQEFFRALGSFLDSEGATKVALEELPEQVKVTYSAPGTSSNSNSQKRTLVLGEQQIHELIVQSRKRRGQKPSLAEP